MQKINPHNLYLYSLPLKYNFNCITIHEKRAWLYFSHFSEVWELVLFDHSIPKSALQVEKVVPFLHQI